MWYLQPFLEDLSAINVFVTQVGIVLAPCVLLALWMRVRAGTTFRTGLPRHAAVAIPFGVVLGLALPSVISAASQLFFEAPDDGLFKELDRKLRGLIHSQSSLQIALLLGVLPALCEEVFFRGFVLSGFRSGFSGRGAAVRAVVASAACFALFHILPERWLPTFVMGVILAWLTIRTGSIWPGVVVHAFNNASVVLAEKHGPAFPLIALYDPKHPSHVPAIAAAFAAVAACLVFVWALTRRRADAPGPARGT
jgi:sodium transport system permease protein